jgi:ERCC4-type nuclease
MDKPVAVVVSAREREPFQFSGRVLAKRGELEVGDYSIAGLERHVAVRRRSLSDLLGCVGGGREWFAAELRQLRAYRFAALVVEARWATVLDGAWGCPSAVHPNAVVGSLVAFAISYGVVPILADNHEIAGRVTEQLLITYSKILEKEYKAMARGAKGAMGGDE